MPRAPGDNDLPMDLQRVSARLSPEALRGWDRACTQTGTNFTAMIEALGQLLNERVDWLPKEAARRAIEVELERNARRRRQ